MQIKYVFIPHFCIFLAQKNRPIFASNLFLQDYTGRHMKAHLVPYLMSTSGEISPQQYVRSIPGNELFVSICSKPKLSKATRKRKAKTSNALAFKKLMEECKAILNTPERREAWDRKYLEAKRQAYKYGRPIQGRLCDFVRHEVSEMIKRGEPIVP